MFFWEERPRTRGPKPALTLEQIAGAAVAVADAEGLAAVSMQRVAAELGFTKMSLYRYVPGKTELVAVMLEHAIGEPPPLTGEWRAAITFWAEALLDRYSAHRWALEATVGGRPIGPNELGWMESALAVLPAGIAGAERMDAVATVAGHVRMIAGQAGTAESELTATIGLVLREYADRFPALTAAVTEAAAHGGQDQAFGFGLGRILDGLELLVQSR
ncbi:TetR/AcrR family transcriptional regulator [Paractinoplanes atraurantiacus]|uniref:Regulatory protein, tetR family n=1 Tax=Paractinoplanes atraurantiacus TaxID=1036182 RepID=A0A285JJU6_9ACTN|nr:TetR/AcrR family transcriptional regulator C-terminal domain-containing protein [Actinoplanes atraurantiacus]SNY60528.1 regulatory protein, tetR family [Actinoplanes atraurantiacus]